MKIILDNVVFSLQKAGGVSLYWFELIKRCSAQDFSFFESKNNNIFSKILNIQSNSESFIPVTLLRYLPFTRSLPNKSIFHSSYYRITQQKSIANVTTVHDFTYEYFSSGLKYRIHTWQKYYAIRRSAGIICVSDNTRKDLIRFVPDIDQSRIKVIHNGVGEEFFPVEDFDSNFGFEELVDKNFILFVGDRSPYKNFDKVVGVNKKLPELCLVVVGGKEFTSEEEGMLADLKGRIYRFSGVSGNALNWLYNHAFCLLYPSSYEGFGIPVIEAMKAGCPVISTNLSSIPEVAGDAALLVNEPSVELLYEKVKLIQDESTRQSYRVKGFVQASNFSWDKCFEETYAFYQEVWNREFGEEA